jgi:hypothetical protein
MLLVPETTEWLSSKSEYKFPILPHNDHKKLDPKKWSINWIIYNTLPIYSTNISVLFKPQCVDKICKMEISTLWKKQLCILFMFSNKYFKLQIFQRLKHTTLHNTYLVVLTVYLHNNFYDNIVGCPSSKLAEIDFHNIWCRTVSWRNKSWKQ